MKQEIWLGCPCHHPQVPTSCGRRPFWRSSTSTACSNLPLSFRRIADGHWTLRTPTPSRSRTKPQSGREGRSGWWCRPSLTSLISTSQNLALHLANHFAVWWTSANFFFLQLLIFPLRQTVTWEDFTFWLFTNLQFRVWGILDNLLWKCYHEMEVWR